MENNFKVRINGQEVSPQPQKFGFKVNMKDFYKSATPKQLKATFNLTDDENVRKVNKLIDETLAEQRKAIAIELNETIEKMLRNYVTPPIVGEITKGKLRYRGIRIAVEEETHNFIGLIQHGRTLILPDGRKIEPEDWKKYFADRRNV